MNLRNFSLPYSLLLDYSNFEFTTLPYPTRNLKTTPRQGLASAPLVVKFVKKLSGAMLLPNLVQATESIPGSVVPLAMFLTEGDPEQANALQHQV